MKNKLTKIWTSILIYFSYIFPFFLFIFYQAGVKSNGLYFFYLIVLTTFMLLISRVLFLYNKNLSFIKNFLISSKYLLICLSISLLFYLMMIKLFPGLHPDSQSERSIYDMLVISMMSFYGTFAIGYVVLYSIEKIMKKLKINFIIWIPLALLLLYLFSIVSEKNLFEHDIVVKSVYLIFGAPIFSYLKILYSKKNIKDYIIIV